MNQPSANSAEEKRRVFTGAMKWFLSMFGGYQCPTLTECADKILEESMRRYPDTPAQPARPTVTREQVAAIVCEHTAGYADAVDVYKFVNDIMALFGAGGEK